jgi:hypothetical protein
VGIDEFRPGVGGDLRRFGDEGESQVII